MPIVKISLSEQQYEALQQAARERGLSVQDVIREKLFRTRPQFTPADAVNRALNKYRPGELFTLPELYGEEWTLSRGEAGSFGKLFLRYVTTDFPECIEPAGKTKNGRQAQYRIKAVHP